MAILVASLLSRLALLDFATCAQPPKLCGFGRKHHLRVTLPPTACCLQVECSTSEWRHRWYTYKLTLTSLQEHPPRRRWKQPVRLIHARAPGSLIPVGCLLLRPRDGRVVSEPFQISSLFCRITVSKTGVHGCAHGALALLYGCPLAVYSLAPDPASDPAWGDSSLTQQQSLLPWLVSFVIFRHLHSKTSLRLDSSRFESDEAEITIIISVN